MCACRRGIDPRPSCVPLRSQVQQITFVQDGQGHMRPPAGFAPTCKTMRSPPRREPGANAAARRRDSGEGEGSAGCAATPHARGGFEPSLGFSEIRVTRHLVHHRHNRPSPRVPPRPISYHYNVCGPHGVGYQQAFTQIRPMSPHDFPWNRLDQLACGWDCDLDLGLKLRCKRFALLDFHEQLEDSLRKLLSAPAGTQRLLSAAMATSEHVLKTPPAPVSSSATSQGSPANPVPHAAAAPNSKVSSDETGALPEPERDPDAPTLSKDRFDRFVTAVKSRLPIGGRVQWVDTPAAAEPQSSQASTAGGMKMGSAGQSPAIGTSPQSSRAVGEGGIQLGVGGPRTHRCLVDMTSDEMASATGDQLGARRMFVQVLFDASASAGACWHLEIRWNMCRGDKVEDLIKYCARRAKQAGMLLLQVPTGRRPRPFSPPVLVPVPLGLQSRAVLELRTRLCFVRESAHATGDLHAGRALQECSNPLPLCLSACTMHPRS